MITLVISYTTFFKVCNQQREENKVLKQEIFKLKEKVEQQVQCQTCAGSSSNTKKKIPYDLLITMTLIIDLQILFNFVNRQQWKQFMQSLLTNLMAHDCKHMCIACVNWLHCIWYFRYQSEQNQAAREYLVEQVSMKVGDTHLSKRTKRKLLCQFVFIMNHNSGS